MVEHSSRQRQKNRKSGILLQIKKVPEASGDDFICYMFSFEDAVAHLSVTNPSGILTIKKQNGRPHAEKFLGLEKILMSVKDLDDCEMPTRSVIKATVNIPYPWPGPKDQQNKHLLYLCHVNL